MIVSGLSQIDARLSGDDSPLANPWEEIKEQLQNEQSMYWQAYLETMRQFVTGLVAGLDSNDLKELKVALKCASAEGLERKLMQRLLARGKGGKSHTRPSASSTSAIRSWTSPFMDRWSKEPVSTIAMRGRLLRRPLS